MSAPTSHVVVREEKNLKRVLLENKKDKKEQDR
jgi:hypothetical protein